MLAKLIKYTTALVILLHCMGATQLASSYAKDKTAFVSMINMAEEETKKEKECGDEDTEEFFSTQHHKVTFAQVHTLFTVKNIYFRESLRRITHQFVIESPTPPPDFNA
jgi:hypothetical protein